MLYFIKTHFSALEKRVCPWKKSEMDKFPSIFLVVSAKNAISLPVFHQKSGRRMGENLLLYYLFHAKKAKGARIKEDVFGAKV
jgi:hypothetical protein